MNPHPPVIAMRCMLVEVRYGCFQGCRERIDRGLGIGDLAQVHLREWSIAVLCCDQGAPSGTRSKSRSNSEVDRRSDRMPVGRHGRATECPSYNCRVQVAALVLMETGARARGAKECALVEGAGKRTALARRTMQTVLAFDRVIGRLGLRRRSSGRMFRVG